MKKMTRQEAFDFLKNTKVKVTPEQSKRIQEIAFRVGYQWIYIGHQKWGGREVRNENEPYLFFCEDYGIYYDYNSANFEVSENRRLEAGDILDIEIVSDDVDAVNHPSHYNNYSVEVLEMMRGIWGDEKVAIFCELNAFKYRMRMGLKEGNPIEQDLAKEKFYLEYIKKLNK